ncbi:jerky-like protein [Trichonephila clavipes]|nr:jerky-like protein [Trichonephila clavipes]
MASNSKRKRNVLNIETKLEILNRLAKERRGASLTQLYNVQKSTISDIKKPRNHFKFCIKTSQKMENFSENGSKKRKIMREANGVVLDRTLYLWFSQSRSKGDPISDPLLCEKARNQRPCSEKTKVYNGTTKNK